ncbi:MAG: bifunctional phosphoglucose/phosphomannose isomerase [Actinomycetota bacterium]
MDELLPDSEALRAADPQGLIDSYLGFGEQLGGSYEPAASWGIEAGAARAVVFCGMGGSAAAGDLVSAAYSDDSPVPLEVVRGYRLPAWIGRDTLVIALSFSGNTEETITAFDEAAARGAHVVAISAGGKLGERAASGAGQHVAISGVAPQPRAALGSLTGAAVGVLVASGVLDDASSEIAGAAEDLATIRQELSGGTEGGRAAKAAGFVSSRVPVVWGSEGVSGTAAWRWKCAFNENAKIPAFASALPELNHHEVVGWTKGHADAFCLIVLREPGEHGSVQKRLDATLPEIRAADVEVLEIRAEVGRTPLSRGLELMLVGDVASAYHAIERGIDPAPIEAIARVKARLEEGS